MRDKSSSRDAVGALAARASAELRSHGRTRCRDGERARADGHSTARLDVRDGRAPARRRAKARGDARRRSRAKRAGQYKSNIMLVLWRLKARRRAVSNRRLRRVDSSDARRREGSKTWS